MIIKNASVYTEDGFFHKKDIYIENDHFVNAKEEVTDQTERDGTGCMAIPGLIDMHFHGCVGYDFCDGTLEAIDAISAY